jgi:cytochrome c oxidase subunit IV
MADAAETRNGHNGQALAHPLPAWLLLAVWGALLALTVVTVAVTYLPMGDLPALGLWIAMGIATVKATLVALYFMHLRWDRPFHAIVFVTALLCIMLLVGLAMLDTKDYQPNIRERQQRNMP